MGKFLLLILLVTVFKSNEHIFVFGGFLPVAKQVEGAFGFASSIFGGISSGLGLSFGGQIGTNTQRHPAHNSYSQYPRPQNAPEEVIEVIIEDKPKENNYASPNQPPYGYHSDRRQPQPYQTQNYDYTHQTRPQHSTFADYGSGYENQGQQQNPTQYGHENYYNNYPHTENNPTQSGDQHGGNFNINGNYGNQNPDNQYLGNNPYSHNKGFNNNRQPEIKPQGNDGNRDYYNNQYYQNGKLPKPTQQTYSKPDDENNNQNNENNQEYLISQIFGNNPQYNGINSGNPNPNNGGLNSGSQNYSNGFATGNQKQINNNSDNKSDKPLVAPSKPLTDTSDLPTFVPLSSVDNKREIDKTKSTEDTEEFNIDVRIKDN